MMVGAWGPSREEQGMMRKDPDRIGPRGTTPLKNGSKNKAEKNPSVPSGTAAPSRWLKPLVDYERRGTSEGGSRYG
jgi:hypothetical protein